MERNKLKKIAGINQEKELTIILDDSKILDKLDQVKDSLPETPKFDDSNITDGLDEIKNILLNGQGNEKSVYEAIKSIVLKLNQADTSIQLLDKKIAPVKIDFKDTNKLLEKISRNIVKLESPFIWLKEYFNKIIDYLKEIVFFFEKPRETILIKKDGRVSEIVYKYSDREVIEKITRNIGETRFIRDERRNI